MEPNDTINVDISVSENVEASGADMLVTVRGDSLVTGRAALKKAREVRALVDALAAFGVTDEDIHLEGIRASVSSGLISKSSSATFDLRIRCNDLEKLGDLVGAVTSQKQADLNHIEWRFPDRHKLQKQLLQKAVPQAREKAELIATLLDVELLGVHELTENHHQRRNDSSTQTTQNSASAPVRARKGMSSEDLGMEVSHSKTFRMSLQASFRIGPLG